MDIVPPGREEYVIFFSHNNAPQPHGKTECAREIMLDSRERVVETIVMVILYGIYGDLRLHEFPIQQSTWRAENNVHDERGRRGFLRDNRSAPPAQWRRAAKAEYRERLVILVVVAAWP